MPNSHPSTHVWYALHEDDWIASTRNLSSFMVVDAKGAAVPLLPPPLPTIYTPIQSWAPPVVRVPEIATELMGELTLTRLPFKLMSDVFTSLNIHGLIQSRLLNLVGDLVWNVVESNPACVVGRIRLYHMAQRHLQVMQTLAMARDNIIVRPSLQVGFIPCDNYQGARALEPHESQYLELLLRDFTTWSREINLQIRDETHLEVPSRLPSPHP